MLGDGRLCLLITIILTDVADLAAIAAGITMLLSIICIHFSLDFCLYKLPIQIACQTGIAIRYSQITRFT